MIRPTGLRPHSGHAGEHGQMIVVFAVCLTAIIAMASLLVDGGMAWSNRRQAQAAADTAALAAAHAIVSHPLDTGLAAAIAQLNGFGHDVDEPPPLHCNGSPLPNDGITVNRPPLQGPHSMANDPLTANDYVEVVTTRAMHTTFAAVVGQGCWMISARAVASIGTKSVASCSFCSLNDDWGNHTLVLKNGATLRVDGDIVVNSKDGLTGDKAGKVSFDGNTCVPGQMGGKEKHDWFVCGDGFDIFGDGGYISARTISVVGGWETHDKNIAWADALAKVDGAPCPLHTQPIGYSTPLANVCLGMPSIADPLNDSDTPENIIPVPPMVGAPVAGLNGCPAGAAIPTGTQASPALKTISVGNATICPGTYHGGLKISGSASVTMMPGVYYMARGGFTVANSASLDGTAGVMIYNASGTTGVREDTPGVDHVPPSVPGRINLKSSKLKADPSKDIAIGDPVTLTLELESEDLPAPTGLVTFFDGSDPITGCSDIPVVFVSGKKAKATCPNTSWTTFGSKSISAVYFGDTLYNPDGDAMTITISPPAGAPIAPVTIGGTGNVRIYGETSGVYKGLTIFQDRTSDLTITLQPGAGAPACVGTAWLHADVPDDPNVETPEACGPLGGLRGTIYAANQNALVHITASGLANLQVISGKIQIDSDADARFAYTPEYFANGSIRLVE